MLPAGERLGSNIINTPGIYFPGVFFFFTHTLLRLTGIFNED